MNPEEQLDVELEMNKITLAGMSGDDQLKESIKTLVRVFGVEVDSPKPIDVAKEMQVIIIDVMSGAIDDNTRDERLKVVLGKAISAKDELLGEAVGDSTPAIS